MKNAIFLMVFYFIIISSYAQVMQATNGASRLSGTAGAMKQVKQTPPIEIKSNKKIVTNIYNTKSTNNGSGNDNDNDNEGSEFVSNWIQASTCFPEIYYQVKTRDPNHPRNYKHDGTYSVWIKFKNNSGKTVKFWARMNVPNSNRGEFELNYQLAPGAIDQNPFVETHTNYAPSSVEVNIIKATYNVNTTNYIECKNGVLNNELQDSNLNENDLKIREREACQKLYKNNKPAYYQFCNKTCSTVDQLKVHVDELEEAVLNGFTAPSQTPPPKKKTSSSCTISN